MASREITVTLTPEDWDNRQHGWRFPLLHVPGAQIEALYPDGAKGDRVDPASVPFEHGLIKWKSQSPAPASAAVIVALTRDLAEEIPALERARLRLEEEKLVIERAKGKWQTGTAVLGGIVALLGAVVPFVSSHDVPSATVKTQPSSSANTREAASQSSTRALAETLESTKSLRVHDYFRAALVTRDLQRITHLGRPDRSYVFATHSDYARPPMPLGRFVSLLGNKYDKDQDLLLMRCKDGDGRGIGKTARLATWPVVFGLLAKMVDEKSCQQPIASENRAACAARNFSKRADVPAAPHTATALIAETYKNAADFLKVPELRSLVETKLGVDPVSFSGFGLSVAGGGTGDEFDSAENILKKATLPEFLIANVSLAENSNSCRCVRVTPYDARQDDLLDVDAIWDAGDQLCKDVRGLPGRASGS